jgi:cellulose synthase/poly-beta-1,6-N-acetylglucosamine synthase-like glycosyltransferase
MKDLTLVIPAKWESESLPLVLKELKKYNCKKIIVIPKNDESTFASIKNFKCTILKQNKAGFGAAIIEGIKKVRTKYLCIFNADGSFDPKYLKNMLIYLSRENKDFVFNSRYEKKGGSDDDTILTYIGNKFFTNLCNL